MEISIPFRVEYKTAEPVPIPEIIDSLLSLELVLEEAGKNLENFLPGVTVQNVSVRVQEITHGSLKELLIVGVFIAYQEDLEREASALVDLITGGNTPEEFNTLLAVLALVAIVYGAAFVKDLVSEGIKDTPIRRQKKALIDDLARQTGKTPRQVKAILDKRYLPKTRIKQLADASVRFFRPSKSQSNAPIEVEQKTIGRDVVSDAPADYVYKEATKLIKSKEHRGIELELHAKDKDREGSGWSAIPIGITIGGCP